MYVCMYVCMYVYLCYGIHVLYTYWFVKRPNKVAVSQAQSNQQSTIHPWRPRIPYHYWVGEPSKKGIHIKRWLHWGLGKWGGRSSPFISMAPRLRNGKGTNLPPMASELVGENEVSSWLSMPRGCSTIHHYDAHAPFICPGLGARDDGMEVCRTSGVWLEYESIIWKLPRVSEVATNHWVF